MGREYIDKLFEGAPDPDDECYQINFPISEKRSFDPTPMNLRRHFLHRASPLIDEYINAALGTSTFSATSDHARSEVWGILKQLIIEAKNPAPMLDLRGKNIEEQIDKILTLVSTGGISLEEGREYISLVQQGFEAAELPKLMQQMEKLEALGAL
ncbi:MAG: hypothetical protein ACTSQB_00255 [Candidatus Heimdallarchaeota archaeon]